MKTLKALLVVMFMIVAAESFSCDNIQMTIEEMNEEITYYRELIRTQQAQRAELGSEYKQCIMEEREREKESEE